MTQVRAAQWRVRSAPWEVGEEGPFPFFAQNPGPGLVKSPWGIGRQAFSPDVAIASVGSDVESGDQSGHCPGDVFLLGHRVLGTCEHT